MSTTNVDTVTVDELYEYINVLEARTATLETALERLNNDNWTMRKSIAAYKANSTIRRKRREAIAVA